MKTQFKFITFLFLTVLSIQVIAQEKKTQHVEVSRIINAPVESVWKVVGEEFGEIHKSHPKIVSSDYLNDSPTHGCEGAERVCNLNMDGSKYIKEKQVEFNPDQHSFKVQITNSGTLPLDAEYSFAEYKVEKVDENTSKLIFTFDYRTKPAFMGSLAKGKFKKQLSDYMLAVDHYVTTGEEVNAENFKNIKKQQQSK
ncbi:SRPBCC family protein [Flammeovirga sp. SubArs3]|uniref:SRPBCC family protein n=1 Tax=Flammeovirga sp. SubArs3 TaxID=2995316 RepID=UPI00248ADAE8|nr:SRPBCC family protein [Flammeovirga sp. SubArs3]